MSIGEGRFRASCTKIVVKPNDNGNLEATLQFIIKQAKDASGEWVDTSGFFVGYQYITKNKGAEVNEFCCNNYQDVFGWRWREDLDPQWLEDNVHAAECEITTVLETYNGMTKLKLQWLNPPGGGIKAATPEDRAVAKLKFAAAAKQVLGATAQPAIPVTKPTKAAVPANPAKPTAAAPAPAAAPPTQSPHPMDAAWDALQSWYSPEDSEEFKIKEWWRILAAMFPKYMHPNTRVFQPELMQEGEWQTFIQQGHRHILPI